MSRHARNSFSACPVCEPARWDAALVVVPDAHFCARHKSHAVAWLFRRLNIAVARDLDGVASVERTEPATGRTLQQAA